MKRRLFEDLLVSKPEAGPRARGLAVPLSVGLHALAAAALASIPVLTSQALPKPAPPPITVAPVTVAVPQGGGGVRPRPDPREPERQPPPPSANLDPAPTQVPRPTDEPVVEVEDTVSPSRCLVGCAGADARSANDGGGSDGIGDGIGPGPGSPLVRAGGDVRPPTKVRHVNPVYPDLAMRAGVHGVVILECVIDAAGYVVDARVLRGHPLLDAAAVSAVQQWLYTPTQLNNVPVAVILTVTVHFELH